jgi:hypothetical protein
MTLAVNLAQGASNNVTFRNRIITGACVIDQRNAGASVTSTSGFNYPVDRFFIIKDTATTGVMTAQQSSTAPSGFTNSVKLTTTTTQSSLAATDYMRYSQIIEGYNVADLNWGATAASAGQTAKPVTLSFWVYSSLTGTFGGALGNSAWNRTYPFTYTISSANTWEQKSITIAGDTSGTWLTTNGIGLRVDFGLGVGSTYSGTAGSWASALYISATGATNVMATNGATFYLTGVQLEAGTTASPFEYRQYGTELALCQRYLPAFRYNTSSTVIPALTQFNSATTSRGYITFPVPTRVSVTGITISSVSHFILLSYAGGSNTPNAFTMHQGGVNGAGVDVNFGSAVSADKNTGVVAIDNSAGYVYFTGAEL